MLISAAGRDCCDSAKPRAIVSGEPMVNSAAGRPAFLRPVPVLFCEHVMAQVEALASLTGPPRRDALQRCRARGSAGAATPERERPEESARARHAHSNELSHHEHEDELLRPNLIRTPVKLGLDAVVLVVATVFGLTASSLTQALLQQRPMFGLLLPALRYLEFVPYLPGLSGPRRADKSGRASWRYPRHARIPTPANTGKPGATRVRAGFQRSRLPISGGARARF